MKIFRVICVPLILINNNVYTFLSGVLISFATNIFTTLCFEQFDWSSQWHYYLSSLLFSITSATCICLASKMSGVQNYLNNKQITDSKERKSIVTDVTEAEYITWIILFALFLISFVAGIVFLAFKFICFSTK